MKLTNSQKILTELLSDIKVNAGYIDPYSVKSIQINDVIKAGKYNDIVDWSCVFNTILDKASDYLVKGDSTISSFPVDVVTKLAIQIDDFLKALPISYEFLLPLPGANDKINYTFSKYLSTVVITQSEAAKYNKKKEQETDPRGSLLALMTNMRFGAVQPDLAEGSCYLKLKASGYVGRYGELTLYQQDPIFLLKIYISLHYVYGNLKKDAKKATQSFENRFREYTFLVFNDKKEFVKTLTRYQDEASCIDGLTYEGASDDKLEVVNLIFEKLLNIYHEPSLVRLQTQVKNSLFWFFEYLKTDNINLQTIYLTVALDAFFSQEEKKHHKTALLSAEVSETSQQEILAGKYLSELYDARNEIIHGERQIFDYLYESKLSLAKDRARNEVAIINFYFRLIGKKVSKFMKSTSAKEQIKTAEGRVD